MLRNILGIVVLIATFLLTPDMSSDGVSLAIGLPLIGAAAGGLLGLLGGGGNETTTGFDPASQAFIEQMRRQGINISNAFLGLQPGGLDVGFTGESFREFIDPFLEDVVGATQADFARTRQRALRDARVANTLAGTGRGSAGAVRLAETEAALANAEALGLAGLRSSGFDRATELALRRAGINMQRLAGASGAMAAGLGPVGTTESTPSAGPFERFLGGAVSGGLLGAGIRRPSPTPSASFAPRSSSFGLDVDPNLFAGASLGMGRGAVSHPLFSGGIRFGGRRF